MIMFLKAKVSISTLSMVLTVSLCAGLQEDSTVEEMTVYSLCCLV